MPRILSLLLLLFILQSESLIYLPTHINCTLLLYFRILELSLTKALTTLLYFGRDLVRHLRSPNILDSILSENTKDRSKQLLTLACILCLYCLHILKVDLKDLVGRKLLEDNKMYYYQY